jgi:hypothetical protein
LKSGVTQFRQQYEDAIVVKLDPPNSNQVVIQQPMLMPPLIFSILVGEICYNLRGALDYLIYELARLDSGAFQDGTQFPIEDSKDRFDGNAERYLKGVNASHRARIEDLQPYKGCNWMHDLRELSNPDKHRKVTSVAAVTEQELTYTGSRDSLDPNAGPIRTVARPNGTEVHLQFSLTTELRFADGTLIVVALDALKPRVTETLESFKAEFQREGNRH